LEKGSQQHNDGGGDVGEEKKKRTPPREGRKGVRLAPPITKKRGGSPLLERNYLSTVTWSEARGGNAKAKKEGKIQDFLGKVTKNST